MPTNIHVYQFAAVSQDVWKNTTLPAFGGVTYTKLESDGAAAQVTLQATTKMVRIWGEAAFGHARTGPATVNSPWWPAGVPLDYEDTPEFPLGGAVLSVFAPAT
jgi:hypothetical protein